MSEKVSALSFIAQSLLGYSFPPTIYDTLAAGSSKSLLKSAQALENENVILNQNLKFVLSELKILNQSKYEEITKVLDSNTYGKSQKNPKITRESILPTNLYDLALQKFEIEPIQATNPANDKEFCKVYLQNLELLIKAALNEKEKSILLESELNSITSKLQSHLREYENSIRNIEKFKGKPQIDNNGPKSFRSIGKILSYLSELDNVFYNLSLSFKQPYSGETCVQDLISVNGGLLQCLNSLSNSLNLKDQEISEKIISFSNDLSKLSLISGQISSNSDIFIKNDLFKSFSEQMSQNLASFCAIHTLLIDHVPECTTMPEVIKCFSEALKGSDSTLRLMIDVFSGSNRQLYRTYETLTNYRIKLDKSAREITKEKTLHQKWEMLEECLENSYSLLSQHESLKKELISGIKGSELAGNILNKVAPTLEKCEDTTENMLNKVHISLIRDLIEDTNGLKKQRLELEKVHDSDMLKLSMMLELISKHANLHGKMYNAVPHYEPEINISEVHPIEIKEIDYVHSPELLSPRTPSPCRSPALSPKPKPAIGDDWNGILDLVESITTTAYQKLTLPQSISQEDFHLKVEPYIRVSRSIRRSPSQTPEDELIDCLKNQLQFIWDILNNDECLKEVSQALQNIITLLVNSEDKSENTLKKITTIFTIPSDEKKVIKRRTFLSVTYAEPSEGEHFATIFNLIDDLRKHQNTLEGMETKKMEILDKQEIPVKNIEVFDEMLGIIKMKYPDLVKDVENIKDSEPMIEIRVKISQLKKNFDKFQPKNQERIDPRINECLKVSKTIFEQLKDKIEDFEGKFAVDFENIHNDLYKDEDNNDQIVSLLESEKCNLILAYNIEAKQKEGEEDEVIANMHTIKKPKQTKQKVRSSKKPANEDKDMRILLNSVDNLTENISKTINISLDEIQDIKLEDPLLELIEKLEKLNEKLILQYETAQEKPEIPKLNFNSLKENAKEIDAKNKHIEKLGEENSKLSKIIHTLRLELEISNKSLAEAQQNNYELKYDLKEKEETLKTKDILEEKIKKLEENNNDYEILQAKIEGFEHGGKEGIVNNLTDLLHKKVEELNNSKRAEEELNTELNKSKEKIRKLLLKHLLIRGIFLGRLRILLSFLKWKKFTEVPALSFDLLSPSPRESLRFSFSPRLSMASYFSPEKSIDFKENIQTAKQILTDEIPKRNSKLELHQYEAKEISIDLPLLFDFFEEFMEAKYQKDVNDFEKKIKLSTIPDYFYQYLNKKYTIKQVAVKHIANIMQTLNFLYHEKHFYGSFICRMLQIYHKDPIPYQLGLFLTKIKHDLNELINAAKPRLENFEYREYSGGEIFLPDLIDFIVKLFSDDKKSGILTLKLLKPEFSEEIALFRFLHQFKNMNIEPRALFNEINEDGKVDMQHFIQGIKAKTQLWAFDEEMQKMFISIDKNKNGFITETEFIEKFDFSVYQAMINDSSFLITGSQFLTVLIEVFHAKQTKDAAYLSTVIQQKGSAFNKIQFKEIILQLDPSLPQDKIDFLYKKAREISSSDDISFHAICRVVLRYGVGKMGYGVFHIPQLEQFEVDTGLETFNWAWGSESLAGLQTLRALDKEENSPKARETVTTTIKRTIKRKSIKIIRTN
ncbi:unnamed protein product [Blepharisma stoltei]|uniref:EF-hand domain-containing protein n=1 Tax=Blepharisma stoltei TaxID=1481888 RepID=A0AAU9KFH8_9CILI|nr:unnamed protein product [Blepharisma stoltei]